MAVSHVFGINATLSPLGVNTKTVARHKGIFRSFGIMGNNVAEYLTVNGVSYVATVNVGDGQDSFQVFNADTGTLHYKASTPTVPQGTLIHDGKGKVFFASGTKIMVADIARKTLTALPYSPSGVTSFQGIVFDYKGRMWVSSYPTGNLICVDSSTGREIARTPRLGTSNMYTKGLSISVDKKTLRVGTGTADPDLFSVNVDSLAISRVSVPNKGKDSFVHTTRSVGRKIFVWYSDANDVGVAQVYDTPSKTWSTMPFSASKYSISNPDSNGFVYINDSGTIKKFNPSFEKIVLHTVGPSPIKSSRKIELINNSLYLAEFADSGMQGVKLSLTGTKLADITYKVVRTVIETRSMIIDKDANLAYTGGYRGDGLCSVNLSSGALEHSPDRSSIKQIENMILDKEKVYVGSYGSSVIVSYDTNKKLTDSSAYKKLATLGKSHGQSRPYGWAVTNNHVVFGTVPEYGLRGGALGVIDRATGSVKVYNKIIPDLSIVGLVGSGNIVYGTTSCLNGMGIDPYRGDAVVFAADVTTGKVLWKQPLSGVNETQSPVLLNGKLYVGISSGIVEIQTKDGKLLKTFLLKQRNINPGWQRIELVNIPGTKRLVHECGGDLTIVDVTTGQKKLIMQGVNAHIAFDKNNDMWVTTGNDMVKLDVHFDTVAGGIGARYNALGGAAALGYPTGPEATVAGTADRTQSFVRWGKMTTIRWNKDKGTTYSVSYL